MHAGSGDGAEGEPRDSRGANQRRRGHRPLRRFLAGKGRQLPSNRDGCPRKSAIMSRASTAIRSRSCESLCCHSREKRLTSPKTRLRKPRPRLRLRPRAVCRQVGRKGAATRPPSLGGMRGRAMRIPIWAGSKDRPSDREDAPPAPRPSPPPPPPRPLPPDHYQESAD